MIAYMTKSYLMRITIKTTGHHKNVVDYGSHQRFLESTMISFIVFEPFPIKIRSEPRIIFPSRIKMGKI